MLLSLKVFYSGSKSTTKPLFQDFISFEFIFKDVIKNGLTKLLKDTPTMLRNHMIDHIKQESGSTTRDTTKKVDNVFGTMKLSFDER